MYLLTLWTPDCSDCRPCGCQQRGLVGPKGQRAAGQGGNQNHDTVAEKLQVAPRRFRSARCGKLHTTRTHGHARNVARRRLNNVLWEGNAFPHVALTVARELVVRISVVGLTYRWFNLERKVVSRLIVSRPRHQRSADLLTVARENHARYAIGIPGFSRTWPMCTAR